MTSSYVIVKAFLKNVVFESPNTPNMFFAEHSDSSLPIDIDVNSKVANGTSIYLVELHINLSPKTNESLVIFNLDIVYSTMVNILDENISDKDLSDILHVEVPRKAYDTVRMLVWNITRESGFPPIMMSDYSFAEHGVEKESRDKVDKEKTDTYEIGENQYDDFRWLMDDCYSSDYEDESLMDEMNINHSLCPYENLPIYKYYLRFLRPIEYRHPQNDECTDSFWPIFFRLLTGNFDVEYDLETTKNGELDIIFTYKEYKNRLVSNLSSYELKDVATQLFLDMITNLSENILLEDINTEYAETIMDDRLILKEEFFKIYNFDASQKADTEETFVEQLYSKIKECDLKTFIYRI